MSKRGLCYLKLWMLDSSVEDALWPKLEACLIASARYVNTFRNQSLTLPHKMSVRSAIDLLSKTLGLGTIDVNTPLAGLPLIARSHKSNTLALLLPKGPEHFLVYADPNTKIALVKTSEVSAQFSECVQLYRSDFSTLINPSLRSYFPKHIIICANIFKTLMLVLSAILGLMLLEEDNSHNRFILFIFSILALFFVFFIHAFIINRATQNLFLVSMWAQFQLYSSVFSLDLERYAETSWARIERVLERMGIGLRQYFLNTPELITAYCVLAFNTLFLFWFNKQAFLFFIIILLGTLLYGRSLSKNLADLRQNAVLCEDKLDQALAAFGLSFAMAVGLKAQSFLIGRIAELSDELRNHASKIASMRLWAQTSCLGLSLLLLWLLSLQAISGSFMLTCFLIINTFMLSWALMQLVLFALNPRPQPLSTLVLEELVRWSPEISQSVQPVNIQGSIELHDVSFAYPKSSILVIKNASLIFETQKFYALLGPSASGKSTLLKLLMAQEIAQEGHVAFDGQDARSLEPNLLRRYFGVIRQESSTFAGSIRANILCGRDISTRDLEHLLFSHEVFDLLLDLPMGLETYIFDRASNISRLQLVILLLARALIHKPKILFMDEIFKGLNLDQQALIGDYLQSLDITRILVTHDLGKLKPDYIINQSRWCARF